MVVLFQTTNIMNNSRTGEDIYINSNSIHRPSKINERQRIHAPSMQALPSLMEFLEKESQKYPSSPTRINAVST